MKTFSIWVATTMAMLLSACTPSIHDYANTKPKLELEEFFSGPLVAEGILKNRSGTVTRWFTADINAYWQNGVGTLEEHFVFNDGERQTRTWTLTPLAGKEAVTQYLGTANDVKGEAKLSVIGNALFLNYVLTVPYKGDKLDLKVDDRMYLVNEDTIINESILTKWGFKVGTLTLTIRKIEP